MVSRKGGLHQLLCTPCPPSVGEKLFAKQPVPELGAWWGADQPAAHIFLRAQQRKAICSPLGLLFKLLPPWWARHAQPHHHSPSKMGSDNLLLDCGEMRSCEVGTVHAEALSTLNVWCVRKMGSMVLRRTPVSCHINNDSSSTWFPLHLTTICLLCKTKVWTFPLQHKPGYVRSMCILRKPYFPRVYNPRKPLKARGIYGAVTSIQSLGGTGQDAQCTRQDAVQLHG